MSKIWNIPKKEEGDQILKILQEYSDGLIISTKFVLKSNVKISIDSDDNDFSTSYTLNAILPSLNNKEIALIRVVSDIRAHIPISVKILDNSKRFLSCSISDLDRTLQSIIQTDGMSRNIRHLMNIEEKK